MKGHWKITGNIVSGIKQGAYFTQLAWVQEQCLTKLGFSPFPGTLNLEIPEERVTIIEYLTSQQGIELVSPESNFCSGYALPVDILGISGAIVAPAEEVRVHRKNVIEIISQVKLKDALDANDGDRVTLTLENLKLNVDAVVFDLDGTLIDTVPIYYEIIDIVFAELGVPAVSRATLQEAMDDGEFDWGCVLPENMKNRKQEVSQKARKIVDAIAPPMFQRQVKLIPGTNVILREIASLGAKIGLVTSTPAQNMKAKMIPVRNAGLDHLLEVIVTADDVQNKKPSPEPLVQCSEKLGVPLKKCVYVGDTRVDIRAGKAAGMKTVGVLTGFDDYDALKNELPDAIINSIAQLNELLVVRPRP